MGWTSHWAARVILVGSKTIDNTAERKQKIFPKDWKTLGPPYERLPEPFRHENPCMSWHSNASLTSIGRK
jgi:hypothetical protein